MEYIDDVVKPTLGDIYRAEFKGSTISDDIAAFPTTWRLTPLGKRDRNTGEIDPKAPYLINWHKTDCDRQFIASELKSGNAVGIGLRLGEPSGYVVAIDFDGHSAIDYWRDLFGEVPHTVTWTSGKDGRYQALFQVPEAYQNRVKPIRVKADKGEQLEFRYTGHQSVLPPSPHPETNGYVWINNPIDTSVAELPQPVLDYWLKSIAPKRIPQTTPKPKTPKVEASNSIPPIPLEICLARSNRGALSGVSKGSRNEDGYKLACDLIGTADYLHAEGVEFDGDPLELFDRFARGCIPPLSERESDTIWQSAQKSNPTPACKAEGIQNILDRWRRKHNTNPKARESERGDGKKTKPKENEVFGFATSIENGLEKITSNESDSKQIEAREKIGNHLEAIAYVNNPTQDGAALLLEFKTNRGQIRRWTMPRADLAGDGASIVAGLLARDYQFNRKQKTALLDYLHGLGSEIDRSYTVTESSGWIGSSFVLPHKSYGDENLRFRDVDPIPEAIAEMRGTLQGWIEKVAARCEGNSRLILSLGASFAAPLLPIVGVESGGFHLVGETSKGKTTILLIAASVTGVKNIPHWRTTTNGLEAIATTFNNLCLPLDEIGQADPRDVGNIAYMLANGQGKSRMKRDLTNRQNKTWQLMVLSSGEIGMGSYMQQANLTQKGGQEVRLPDIPAIPEGSNYGCFETIHGATSAFQFVGALEAAVKQHHGTALDAFLSRLVVDTLDPSFAGDICERTHLIAAQLAAGTIDTAIARVAKRFALVQVALGLAHKYGLLPFPANQIDWAISTVFKDWLNARGGDGSIEIKRAIDNIQHLLTTHEFGDRVYTLPHNSNRPVRNLLAYRIVDTQAQTQEFLIPPSVFDREFTSGVNKSELVKELQRLGLMLPPRSDGKSVYARRVNGKQNNFYVFPRLENIGDAGDAIDATLSNPEPESVLDTYSLHHHAKTSGDAGIGNRNLGTEVHTSTASPASLPKSQIQDFEHKKSKVADWEVPEDEF